jgi:SSS family transporter
MGFSWIDYVVLAAYLVGITIFGVLFRKSQKTVKDYFVGAKNINWVIISLSIVATETSTLTLIGVPAIAYANYAYPEQGGNFTYLQVVIGYIIARFIISLLFIPAYFRGDILTAYTLLENRFGVSTKNFAASMFLVMRALAEGVRIFAASIVLSAVLGASLPNLPHLTIWSIVIVGVLTLVYTFEGGIAAVIWTDLIQLIIYVGGSLVAAYMLLTLVPGGWNEIHAQVAAVDKFQLFSFKWSYNLPFTFWAGVFGGTFLTMASHGTDQLLVQRLLTCKNQQDSQKALILSGFVVLLQFALFLTIGVMLYAYYNHVSVPEAALTADNCLQAKRCDEIFPRFIVGQLPHGISGLVIAAVFAAAMSNLSGSLNSLASTTILDFYKPLISPDASDESLLKLSKWLTAIWGVVLIVIALLASQNVPSVLITGLTIASIVYGPLLGAFLLGVLTKRANQVGVITGMLASIVMMLTLKSADLLGYDQVPFHDLAWTWFVLVGTVICLVVGYGVSVFTDTSSTNNEVEALK